MGYELLDLAVDTGAGFSLIPNDTVLNLGLNTDKSQEKSGIVTANGLIYAPVVETPLFGALGMERRSFSGYARSSKNARRNLTHRCET